MLHTHLPNVNGCPLERIVCQRPHSLLTNLDQEVAGSHMRRYCLHVPSGRNSPGGAFGSSFSMLVFSFGFGNGGFGHPHGLLAPG
jgi:hypothetical protein